MGFAGNGLSRPAPLQTKIKSNQNHPKKNTSLIMEQITISVFNITELSQKAKEKAREYIRTCQPYDIYAEEAMQTAIRFCETVGATFKSIYYEQGQINYNTNNIKSDILNIKGPRLLSYVWNNYGNFWRGKYYSKSKYENGKFMDKSRRSKVFLTNDCNLTGVIYDESILAPVYKLWKMEYINLKHYTLENLIEDCIAELESECSNEYQYTMENENIDEFAIANDYKFTEDGQPFNY